MKQTIVFVVGPDRCGKTEISKALAKRLNAMYFKASSEHNAYLQSAGIRKATYLSGTSANPVLEKAYEGSRRALKLRQKGYTDTKEYREDGTVRKSELSLDALSSADLFRNQLLYADPRVCDFVRQLGTQFGTGVVFDRGFPCEAAYSHVMNRQTHPGMLDYMDREWSKIGAKIVFCHRKNYDGITDDLDPRINHEVLQKLDDAYMQFFNREKTAHNSTRCEWLDLEVDEENLEKELSAIMTFLSVE